MDDPGAIEVTLLHSPAPRMVREWRLRLAAGARLADALAAVERVSCSKGGLAPFGSAPWAAGIDGRRVAPSHPLRDGDRIELCRPLQVDPKLARRERFSRQGSRASGLFAKRRVGA